MSNRDGKRAKINKRKNVHLKNHVCPKCGSSLDKCDQAWKDGHQHHRHCKTCGYCNY
jgi:predicted RNA-binding Zn-ribbon protein involved in translation (DUF1610 family)